jgi:Ca2+/Na+ antiporter
MLSILLQLIILSILGSVGNLIFYSKHELSKRKMKVRTIIHYIYIYSQVLGCAYLFGWIVPGNVKQTIVMIIMICCVTLCVSYALKKKEDRTAELINEKLSTMNRSNEDNQED